MAIVGYARVSSNGQELDLQMAQLRASGCERIFCEKESGATDDRRQLKRMLRALKPGDAVIVAALDRLTRGGPFKMLSVLNEITSRGAAYRSLAEPWADTTHELGEVSFPPQARYRHWVKCAKTGYPSKRSGLVCYLQQGLSLRAWQEMRSARAHFYV